MQEHFVQTDPREGLTREGAEVAIQILLMDTTAQEGQ